ncbi:MAG: hypothetical protein NC301_07825 [Bacteroides sp.]|nr:hypothetical protein [Bacteroides sp.]MCM1380079.1 hypothetical protein [Bacteroides sp.]MCM1446416.1 hypothetical protein [Prevotella sp.]
MKKLTILAAAALALTGCQKAPQHESLTDLLNQNLERATTFEDSIIAIDGAFIGGAFASQIPMQGIENPDRNEMLRGLRTVLGSDSENASYLAGIAMGMQVINIYKDLSEEEPLSKEKFFAAVAQAFRLDSISREELQELQPRFQETFNLVKEQAQKRKEAEVFKTPAAVQNRMMGEAVAEKYQANPEFTAVGEQGLMKKTITPGDGKIINPNTIIVASATENHADSKHLIRSLGDTPMYAGRPSQPILAGVIPFMSVGETAEFFVPYELAYGILGNENIGVGPCEAVLCTVTVKPYASSEE